jgi:hypothetical protein
VTPGWLRSTIWLAGGSDLHQHPVCRNEAVKDLRLPSPGHTPGSVTTNPK